MCAPWATHPVTCARAQEEGKEGEGQGVGTVPVTCGCSLQPVTARAGLASQVVSAVPAAFSTEPSKEPVLHISLTVMLQPLISQRGQTRDLRPVTRDL
eukprot:1112236-Rhodomonas_salina.1